MPKKRTTSSSSRAKTRGTRKTKTTSKRVTRITTRRGTLHIQHGLGRMKTPLAIAKSLKKAADASESLSGASFHVAMAAIDYLIAFLDRQKERLEGAKGELRKLYGEDPEEEPNRRKPKQADNDDRRAAAKGAGKRGRKRTEFAARPAFNHHPLPT